MPWMNLSIGNMQPFFELLSKLFIQTQMLLAAGLEISPDAPFHDAFCMAPHMASFGASTWHFNSFRWRCHWPLDSQVVSFCYPVVFFLVFSPCFSNVKVNFRQETSQCVDLLQTAFELRRPVTASPRPYRQELRNLDDAAYVAKIRATWCKVFDHLCTWLTTGFSAVLICK